MNITEYLVKLLHTSTDRIQSTHILLFQRTYTSQPEAVTGSCRHIQFFRSYDPLGTTNWFVPFEMAHIAKEESLRFTTVEFEDELTLLMADCHKQLAPLGGFPMFPNPKFYGEVWGNYPEMERKIFKIFDPNQLAPF